MPTITTITRKGPTSWEYQWTGTSPYDAYIQGAIVLSQTTATSLVVQGNSTAASTHTPPAVELRDANSTGTAESITYSPRLRFQWRGQSDASFYQVQRYVDSAWTTQQIVVEDGSGYYKYITIPLSDGATEQWRVVPTDARGYEGGSITIQQIIVCNPDPPDVVFTYSGAGTKTITVSAA